MKIAYLMVRPGSTGGSLVLYAFMDGLSARGHEICLVTVDGVFPWRAGLGEQLVRAEAVRWTTAALARRGARYAGRRVRNALSAVGVVDPSGPADVWLRITRDLTRYWPGADVTIATQCQTAAAAFALMNRTRVLYHMQSYEELFFEHPEERLLARATYSLPLALTANSTWLMGQIHDRFGRKSELVVPGVDRGVFCPRTTDNGKYEELRPFRILSYCSSHPFKGWVDAVSAVGRVMRELGPGGCEWTIFGERPAHPEDTPIRYVGRVFGADLASLYSAAHVVLVPSWFESFPLPPIEAMSCRTVVVTTPIGTEDYVRSDKNAVVVPPRDPGAMGRALVMLARRPEVCRALADEGTVTARHFSWNSALDRLEAILVCLRHAPLGGPFADLVGGGSA